MLGKKLGDYEILEKIGAGGMGEVYRARDTKLQREVALKILPGAFVSDPERMARFQREARTLASLNHPHIATLYDFAESDGQPYLIMELVEGEDLADRLTGGPIPLDEALDIARQVADGLEEAHEKGVIHRDLKPANLKITPDGKAKILDFGLARAYLGETVDEGEVENSPTITAALTQKGMILGTAAYMSPEQARGKVVDRRADLWSFGVILWEMLTGKRLFEGETVSDTLAAVLRKETPWDELPAGTPPGVRRLLERCLERNPRKRLRDIGEARIRLERWRDDPSSMHQSMMGVEAAVDSSRPQGSSRLRMVPWLVAALAVALALWSWFLPPEVTTGTLSPLWLNLSIPLEDELNDALGGGISLSPTGEMFAHIADDGIYLRRLDQLQSVHLTGTEGAYLAEFSPDGQWLAFAVPGFLKRISITGGAAIEICEIGTCRGFGWIDRTTLILAKSINTGLTVVSLESGEVRDLTTLDTEGGERSHRWPSVVPGGKYVLMMNQYLGETYEDAEIQLVSLATGKRSTAYRGGAYPRYVSTGHLLFSRDNTLFAIPYSPELEQATGLAVPVLENVLTSVVNQEIDDGSASYSFSPTGRLIYRSGTRAAAGNSRLAWLDLESQKQIAFGDPARRDSPILSPDGKSLAICRGEVGSRSIYIVDLATQIERRLSFQGGDVLGVWSKDSEYLYWARAGADGWSLLRQRADGAAPEESLHGFGSASFIPADISQDGRFLLGTQYKVGDSYDAVIISVGDPSSEPIALAAGPGGQYPFCFSPDGRWVLYLEDKQGENSVHIMPYPDTGTRWQVMDHLDRLDGAWWIEEGATIVVRDGTGLLRVHVDVRGESFLISTPERILTENNIRTDGAPTATLTADGKRMLVLQPEGTQDEANQQSIIFVNDWLPELKKRVARSQ